MNQLSDEQKAEMIEVANMALRQIMVFIKEDSSREVKDLCSIAYLALVNMDLIERKGTDIKNSLTIM